MDLKLELSRDHLAAEIYARLIQAAYGAEFDKDLLRAYQKEPAKLHEGLARIAISAAGTFVRILKDPQGESNEMPRMGPVRL